jgi:hypothetical protein
MCIDGDSADKAGEIFWSSPERRWLGWTILLAGWILWFVSLSLPYGGLPTLALVFLFSLLLTGALLLGDTSVLFASLDKPLGFVPLSIYLVCAILLLIATFGMLVFGLGERWWKITRIISLSLLGSFYLMYQFYQANLHDNPSEPFGLGFPVLVLGSILIFIGLWLIPPKNKWPRSGRRGF